jgi:hypothetical protein
MIGEANMGRRRATWTDIAYRGAAEAFRAAWQLETFTPDLLLLIMGLRAYRNRSADVRKQGADDAFGDLRWKEKQVDETGRIHYVGPYYDIREFCDVYALPWPVGGEILSRFAYLPTSTVEVIRLPDDDAIRAWRMAKSGWGRPTPEELNAAFQLGEKHTAALRDRDFTAGLTQGTVAEMLHTDDRTVRRRIAECWRYIARNGVNGLFEHLDLPIVEQIAAMCDERFVIKLSRFAQQDK